MASPLSYHLHASLGYQLSLAARRQERRLEEHLKTLGLTRLAWCILLACGIEDLHKPSDISTFIGVDRTATSRCLKAMESQGLIARVSGTTDRRTTTVQITARGQDLLEQGIPFAQANNQAMADNLTPDEKQTLDQLLRKLHTGQTITLQSF